jgi:hypothetical protein
LNCFARGDAGLLAPGVLEMMPPHLRPPRMRPSADGGLEPNYDVHDTLAAVGLADIAAWLPADHRVPRELTKTGISGGRIDRFYLTEGLAEATTSYRQQDTGGSDHQALLHTLDTAAVSRIVPREPAP